MDGELLTKYERRWCPGKEDTEGRFIRYIKLNENEKESLWQRFAILPNVDGQKYTIGKSYSSREEQGEFIFLDFYPYTRTPEEEREWECEIIVEKNKYFVTKKFGRPSVLINEVIIATRTELRFGDYLSFKDNSSDCVLKDEYEVYLFKERELNPEKLRDSPEANAKDHRSWIQEYEPPKNPSTKSEIITGEFIPGQNELILSHIMSYLPVLDIKTARLVSKLWNDEGFKILRKRCVLNLNLSHYYRQTNESMKLFRYSVEMKNRSMSNWRICLSEHGKCTSAKTSEVKLLDDLNLFIFNASADFQHIKRLGLGGRVVESKFDFDLLFKLLKVLGKELEELTLDGGWTWDFQNKEEYPNIQLTKLRIFTLSMEWLKFPKKPQKESEDEDSDEESDEEESDDEYPTKDCSSFSWLHFLVKLIQKVTTFRFKYSASSRTFLNFIHKNEYWNMFVNLTEINVLFLNSDVIKLLQEVNKPLKKLVLGDLMDTKRKHFYEFGRLLLKHSQSLESLEFIIPNDRVEGKATKRKPIFIKFPTFPKLLELKVFIGPIPDDFFDLVKLKFPGLNGIINYENDLPCLKSLTLWPSGPFGRKYVDPDYRTGLRRSPHDRVWKQSRSLYQLFFPAIVPGYVGEVESCWTVQYLYVLEEVRTNNREGLCPLFTETAESVIAEMFPKVENNPWMDSIRDRTSNKAGASTVEKNKPQSKRVIKVTVNRETKKLRSPLDESNIGTIAKCHFLRPRKR